jgi:carbonic anhydrase/acetyltransferase-like protein (isoleucine patch superfamily)
MTAAMLAAIGDWFPKVGGHTFEYIHVYAGRWRTVMLLEHKGAVPKIDPTARIAPNAVLCGQVTIGANSSIGFGAVLSAEGGPITVGSNCVIMDTATVRGLKRNPVRIGNNVHG